jgi:hypothetical protein
MVFRYIPSLNNTTVVRRILARLYHSGVIFGKIYLRRGEIMTINDEINTRINLTIPKELKQQLETEAKEQGRSLNNYILYILNTKRFK